MSDVDLSGEPRARRRGAVAAWCGCAGAFVGRWAGPLHLATVCGAVGAVLAAAFVIGGS